MAKIDKKLVLYSIIVFIASLVYFIFTYSSYGYHTENESFLGEIGGGIGVVAVWGLVIIYLRTFLKMLFAKGPFLERFVPEEAYRKGMGYFRKFMYFMDRTHPYVGVATIMAVLLHAYLIGLDRINLFFALVILLVVWQGIFGFFILFRYSPAELKRKSYFIHSQLITGVMIVVFALFGHFMVGR